MIDVNLEDLARETHQAEIARRVELTDALAFPTGLLVVLIGAIGTMLTTIDVPISSLEYVLLVFALLSVLPATCAIFFLVKARMAHTYDYPAHFPKIREWYDQIISYGYSSAEAKNHLKTYLFEEHVRCSGVNALNNDQRSAQIFKANQALVWLIGFAALSGIPFVAMKIIGGKLPQKDTGSIVIESKITGSGAHGGREATCEANRGSPADPAPAADKTHPREHRATKNKIKDSVRATLLPGQNPVCASEAN